MGWTELADDIESAYGAFVAVAAELSAAKREEGGVCGQWSPREVVLHLIGWDEEVARALGLFASGDGELYVPPTDADAFNANSVAMRADLDWDGAMAGLAASYAMLVAAIHAADAAGCSSDSGFGRAIRGRSADYRLHAGQLATWL